MFRNRWDYFLRDCGILMVGFICRSGLKSWHFRPLHSTQRPQPPYTNTRNFRSSRYTHCHVITPRIQTLSRMLLPGRPQPCQKDAATRYDCHHHNGKPGRSRMRPKPEHTRINRARQPETREVNFRAESLENESRWWNGHQRVCRIHLS